MSIILSVLPGNVRCFSGLSSDPKPGDFSQVKPVKGDIFYENDTGAVLTFGGSFWRLRSKPAASFAAIDDTPVLMIGGDHALKQWHSDNGYNGMAQMYFDQGIAPYLAVNTQDDAGEYVGASTDKLTWGQLKALQDRGIEILSHGSQHVQAWHLINTGIKITYAGAGTLVLITTSGSYPAITLTATCTGAAGDNFAIDCSTLTLTQLKAAIEATGTAGTWTCRISPELTGNESANNIPGCTASESVSFSSSGGILATYTTDLPTGSPVVFAGTMPDALVANTMYWTIRVSATTSRLATSRANALAATAIAYGTTSGSGLTMYREGTIVKPMTAHDTVVGTNQLLLAVGGGITIQYTGSVYKSAYVNITATPTLDLYGDGVQVATFTLSNASYDTLAELVAAINAVTGFVASVMDNNQSTTYANQSYVSGNEKSARLWRVAGVDVVARPYNFEFGLTVPYMISRMMQESVDTAAANGVTLKNFAVSGGTFYPWLADGARQCMKKLRGNIFVRSSISPTLTPFGERNDDFHVLTTVSLTQTLSQMQGWIDALCASPGHYMDLLIHSMQADGTSGYAIRNPVLATASILEADMFALLKYIKSKVDAGQLVVLQPDQARGYVKQAPPPVNMIKNPRLVNPGGVLTGYASANGTGLAIPAWLLTSPASITAFTVSNGEATITSNANTLVDVLGQEVLLKPGVTYELSCDMEMPTYTSGNGIYWRLQKRLTSIIKGMQPHTSNTVFTSFKYLQSGRMSLRFTVPKRDDSGLGYIRSTTKGPWDLSAAGNVAMKVNLAAKGAVDNINVQGATPATTHADEIAIALNNAIKANATYRELQEYWNVFSAEDGYLIGRLPWRYADNQFGISMDAATSNGGATLAVMGSATVRGINFHHQLPASEDFYWKILLSFDMTGTVKIRNPTLREDIST